MRRIALRLLGWAVGASAAAWLAGVGYLYFFQRSFIFEVPSSPELASPAEQGLAEMAVVKLALGDGIALTGWQAAPRPGNPVILYFHGNSGNLGRRADRFRQMLDAGFGLVAFSYRGYPGSGGSPSEAAFFEDALLIFDRLAGQGAPVVLYGESMGTGVATYVASERKAEALVLEAPFTAISDIAAAKYPWVPVSYLMTDQFRSLDRIAAVDEPLLIVHGTADAVVPVADGTDPLRGGK